MILNDLGKIIKEELMRTTTIRKEIKIDYFTIMPNHLHIIIIIENESNTIVGANGCSPLRMQPKSISSFVSGFKSICTKRINELRGTLAFPVWQRNYFEHVIRNDKELSEIRRYIENNPLKWMEDEYFDKKT
jgi:putative transposase